MQDRGRYKCYTSTRKGSQEMFVNLEVKGQSNTVELNVIMLFCQIIKACMCVKYMRSRGTSENKVFNTMPLDGTTTHRLLASRPGVAHSEGQNEKCETCKEKAKIDH